MIAVAEGGSIIPLIKLLESSSITCCEAAAWALKNIACHEDNVILICNANGIEGLVRLLNKNLKQKYDSFQKNNINESDDIYENNQNNKINEVNEDNEDNYLTNQNNDNYWRLIEAIVSALGALTCSKENKLLIGDLGTIGSLLQLIKEDTSDR